MQRSFYSLLATLLVLRCTNAQDTGAIQPPAPADAYCRDGNPVIGRCNQQTATCEYDTTLNCENVKGIYFCCAPVPDGQKATCADGANALAECDAATKTCTLDPTLGCEAINGASYCCAKPVIVQPPQPPTLPKFTCEDGTDATQGKQFKQGYDNYSECDPFSGMCTSDPTKGCETIQGHSYCCGTVTIVVPKPPPVLPTFKCGDGTQPTSECDAATRVCLTDPNQGCEAIQGHLFCCPRTVITGPDPKPLPVFRCSDGSVAGQECDAFTRTCTANPSMGCETVQGHVFCCGQTPVSNCQDYGPGCPGAAYLCNNARYYKLMTQHCPRTCNRCGQQPTTGVCADRGSPSDCPKRASLCNKPAYYDLMTVECPVTCNRCGVIPGTGTAPNTGGSIVGGGTGIVTSCSDRGNDCPKVPHLCNNQLYYKLMTQQCAKTCGRCATAIRGRGKFIYYNGTEDASQPVVTRTTPGLWKLRQYGR